MSTTFSEPMGNFSSGCQRAGFLGHQGKAVVYLVEQKPNWTGAFVGLGWTPLMAGDGPSDSQSHRGTLTDYWMFCLPVVVWTNRKWQMRRSLSRCHGHNWVICKEMHIEVLILSDSKLWNDFRTCLLHPEDLFNIEYFMIHEWSQTSGFVFYLVEMFVKPLDSDSPENILSS